MSPSDMVADLGALMNGEDPDSGEEVVFDDTRVIGAEFSGPPFDLGPPLKLKVTGWKLVEERLVLTVEVDDDKPNDGE